MSRPSSYSERAADVICARLADGESLRSICKDTHLPSARAVHRWLNDDENESFRQQYARAREVQADKLFDDILSISDDKESDVQRSRLQVDARKWMAGKLRPKKYGDKQEIEHSGSVSVNVVDYSKASDD